MEAIDRTIEGIFHRCMFYFQHFHLTPSYTSHLFAKIINLL